MKTKRKKVKKSSKRAKKMSKIREYRVFFVKFHFVFNLREKTYFKSIKHFFTTVFLIIFLIL